MVYLIQNNKLYLGCKLHWVLEHILFFSSVSLSISLLFLLPLRRLLFLAFFASLVSVPSLQRPLPFGQQPQRGQYPMEQKGEFLSVSPNKGTSK